MNQGFISLRIKKNIYAGCQIQGDTKILNSHHDIGESSRVCGEESYVCHTNHGTLRRDDIQAKLASITINFKILCCSVSHMHLYTLKQIITQFHLLLYMGVKLGLLT
jgi:hypothetical protein